MDWDAFKLIRLEKVWKVFVAEVAPPGPVITIVIGFGGGVIGPVGQSWCNGLGAGGPAMHGMALR